jgi:hypothetical protein
MNRNNTELAIESCDIYQSAVVSPFSKQQQQQQQPNANLEWTKLIQTATKAFESKNYLNLIKSTFNSLFIYIDAHRSSDNLYYSDLLNDQPPSVSPPPPPPPTSTSVKKQQNSFDSDAIIELKESFLKIKLELDQVNGFFIKKTKTKKIINFYSK